MQKSLHEMFAASMAQLRPLAVLDKYAARDKDGNKIVRPEGYCYECGRSHEDFEEEPVRDLINGTLDWARDRNLLDNKDADRQALKMVTEVGEFVDEILKGDKEKQLMEMGDVLVTIILTGAKLGIDIEDALAAALDKIQKRTGKTINGVFVKD